MTQAPAIERYTKSNEALRLDAYDDATGRLILPGHAVVGTLTIGWGHTGPDVFAGQTIDINTAQAWFERDLAAALRGAVGALGNAPWLTLDSVRCCALTDMCFELGEEGLAGFHKMLAAIRAGDWATAADEVKASEYYGEVPKRAERTRSMLLTGAWPAGFAA